MSNFEDLMKGLVRNSGTVGLKELEGTLAELQEEAKSPMNRVLLNLASEAVGVYGPEGIKEIEKLIDKIGEDDDPDMDFASLKARSDYLSVLQNAEADDKSRAKDFFRGLGESLNVVLKSILAGLAG